MKQQTNTIQTDNSVQQLLEALKKQNELYKQVLAGLAPIAEKSKVENRRGVLKFTKKEISQMPTQIKNIFAANDLIVHYRLRKDGVYEARFHRQGIDIEVSSKDLTKLKQKFIEKLNNYDGSSKRRKRNRNCKECMGKNVVKRKIPITPMMKQVLPYIDFKKAKNVNLNTLQTTMKRLFPNHHSHELRYAFISRCKESDVLSEVDSIWAGHSLTGTITKTVYTHYLEEFQLREAEKVNYTKWNFDS